MSVLLNKKEELKHLLIYKIKTEYYNYLVRFLIKNKNVDKLIKNKQFFFILAIGRSGTTFLSNLLNLSPNALVVHEPIANDIIAYNQAFNNEKNAYKYINSFRMKEIYYRIKKENFNVYGEVNGFLRRHCKTLINSFSNSDTKFFHLVRDGRDVVRSIASRKSFFDDKNNKIIIPKQGDYYRQKWKTLTKFEKICWLWKEDNEYINKYVKERINFEQIISNYNYLKEKLLNPLGLEISEKIWKDKINKHKNITVEYKIPHWKEWDKEKIKTFNLICGETMKKMGY